MKDRPHGFLGMDKVPRDSEAFDYVVELHEYLWRVVNAVTPGASGNLKDYLPKAIETLERERSSADSAHAKIANWLEDQARIATNGLHCGDNSTVIKHTYDWADKLEAAARHLRAEPRASADSAEPVAWAILGSNSASGIWKILQDKASADYWATQGFQVQPLGYLNRPASRAQPQTAPSDIERAFQDACDEAGCAYDNEALLEAIHALKERCQAEIVPVPKAALDWLFGEGAGPDGKWFCDDQDTEQRTPRRYSRAYWWRSKFRSMIPALTRPQRDPAACPSCGGTDNHTSGCAK